MAARSPLTGRFARVQQVLEELARDIIIPEMQKTLRSQDKVVGGKPPPLVNTFDYELSEDGVNVFSTDATLVFDKGDTTTWDTTTIYTSAEGTEGTSVDIHKSLLLSALSVDTNGDAGATYDATGANNRTATAQKDFAVENTGTQAVDDLADVGLDQINGALDNVIWLRGQTAAGLSRLKFAQESVATEKINMGAALGRIEDADIAEESAKLAKYTILMQASAAMIAQANQQSQVALTLLR